MGAKYETNTIAAFDAMTHEERMKQIPYLTRKQSLRMLCELLIEMKRRGILDRMQAEWLRKHPAKLRVIEKEQGGQVGS